MLPSYPCWHTNLWAWCYSGLRSIFRLMEILINVPIKKPPKMSGFFALKVAEGFKYLNKKYLKKESFYFNLIEAQVTGNSAHRIHIIRQFQQSSSGGAETC